MNVLESYKNKTAALGTKHNKEIVIQPIFKKNLCIEVLVPKDLETDKFGTFTLDVDRISNQKETATIKAKAAMKILGLDLGIASEGSFGVHPMAPFVTSNIEIVVFIDSKNDLTIFGGHVQAAPYAQNRVAKTIKEVLDFAKNIDFPNHAIVIKRAQNKFTDMVKGINNTQDLIKYSNELLSKNKTIWLETDMRAHQNKSRMQNIKLATVDLIQNITRLCLECGTPGFHKIDPVPGLECEQCARPTDLTLYDVYYCDKCEYKQNNIYTNIVKTAYAGHCDYCNP